MSKRTPLEVEQMLKGKKMFGLKLSREFSETLEDMAQTQTAKDGLPRSPQQWFKEYLMENPEFRRRYVAKVKASLTK